MISVIHHLHSAENAVAIEAPKFNRIKAGVFFIIIVLLIVATYFSPHIWHHGEAREALVIQDIVKNHRWVLPLRNGELPSKPILYHWMAASFALPLGLSDFTVRLPSVVGAALLVWVTYAVGAFGTNRKTGLLAVAILASTFEFWDSGTWQDGISGIAQAASLRARQHICRSLWQSSRKAPPARLSL
ncbi:MAG: hypothetical protein E6J74_01620 [Deltaproteobacteria bacterium]|nr:MAG: hypothetical protein E6J74_01620 [Deltaproteobacteria bacterium]